MTTNNDSNDISIILNQGNNTFSALPRILVGGEPGAVSVGNLDDDNGDGRANDGDFLDVVTANFRTDNITVLPSVKFLKSIPFIREDVLVTIEGREVLAIQLDLAEEIPLGPSRLFIVSAFLEDSLTPDCEGSAIEDVFDPEKTVIVTLNCF